MQNSDIQWTYGVLRTAGALEAAYQKGPMPPERIRELLGGDYELIELYDGVIAARIDRASLPMNEKMPQFNGDLLLGRVSNNEFIGYSGVLSQSS